jgi:hypothetical protein
MLRDQCPEALARLVGVAMLDERTNFDRQLRVD